MFHFPRFAPKDITHWISAEAEGFPHSDISGSKATYRLPGTFRRLVTSFIAILSLGIHRALLLSPVRRHDHHNQLYYSDEFALHAAPPWKAERINYLCVFDCQRTRCATGIRRTRSRKKNPPFRAGSQLLRRNSAYGRTRFESWFPGRNHVIASIDGAARGVKLVARKV